MNKKVSGLIALAFVMISAFPLPSISAQEETCAGYVSQLQTDMATFSQSVQLADFDRIADLHSLAVMSQLHLLTYSTQAGVCDEEFHMAAANMWFKNTEAAFWLLSTLIDVERKDQYLSFATLAIEQSTIFKEVVDGYIFELAKQKPDTPESMK